MKLIYRSCHYLTYGIFISLALSVTHAQMCSEFFINATGSQTLADPFKPPTGPLSNTSSAWTWTIATESYPGPAPNTSVRDTLWLSTEPTQNLLSPDLGYLGCGLIAHGLTSKVIQQGQNDTGDCSAVLTPACVQAFKTTSTNYSQTLSGSLAVPIHDICEEFRTRNWEKYGVPQECKDAFDDHAWVETFQSNDVGDAVRFGDVCESYDGFQQYAWVCGGSVGVFEAIGSGEGKPAANWCAGVRR
ncbi:MAG: hypothetical protein Q9225_005010 [Loekoesia sp. 1 TL-2023]